MIKKNVMFAGLAIAGVLSAPVAWAAETSSQAFITKAIQGNLAEISVGQLAQKMGATDAVKQVGETLVTDHTKANQAAMSAASTLGLTPPTGPTAEQQKMHDMLAGETGATFDKNFLTGMIADHKKDIADYEKAASNDKDAAGQYANQTLPDLKKHLAQLEAANGGNGGAAAANDGKLMSGANSFTEGQAKSHIEKAGYSGVSALKKDDQGIWRGTATKNGQSVPVGIDFKGHVVSQ